MNESTNATKHRYQELIDSLSQEAQYRFWDAVRDAIMSRGVGGVLLLKQCDTCDGTGEVHSHNPICWSCHGRGLMPYHIGKQLAKIIEDDTGREMEVWT